MAKKRQKKEQSFNSLEALGKFVNKEESKQSNNRTHSKKNNAKNFYSFLHKRNRFFEEDVIINSKKLKDHEKFNIKKINIDKVTITEDGRGKRPRTNQKELLKEFHHWESSTFYKGFVNRHLENAKNICEQIEKENFKPNWRLAIGLGTGSVFETSITLHHIYGFPYIPASAVKGVVRSWIIQNVFGNIGYIKSQINSQIGEEEYPMVNAEFRALTQSEAFCKIFGCPSEIKPVLFKDGKPLKEKKENKEVYKSGDAVKVALKNEKNEGQENQGKVTFFDAFPTKAPTIKADVMTPHYGDYYSDSDNNKRVAPTDTMSPNPIPFLTVEDTPFQFLFGAKDFDITQKLWAFNTGEEGKTLTEWLKSALQNHGIGAKTAVGYGYMS